MKDFENVTLDDMKSGVNEQIGGFMDEQTNNMLSLVKEHESEQDYWFVKYYLMPSFCIFTMGGMAAQINENAWIKPWEGVSEDLKEQTIDMLKDMTNKDMWELFKGREELAFRLFAYGTHQAQLGKQEEERKKSARKDWSYAVITFAGKDDKIHSCEMRVVETEERAKQIYDKADMENDDMAIMLHVHPHVKELLGEVKNAIDVLSILNGNSDKCIPIHVNDKLMDFLQGNANKEENVSI